MMRMGLPRPQRIKKDTELVTHVDRFQDSSSSTGDGSFPTVPFGRISKTVTRFQDDIPGVPQNRISGNDTGDLLERLLEKPWPNNPSESVVTRTSQDIKQYMENSLKEAELPEPPLNQQHRAPNVHEDITGAASKRITLEQLPHPSQLRNNGRKKEIPSSKRLGETDVRRHLCQLRNKSILCASKLFDPKFTSEQESPRKQRFHLRPNFTSSTTSSSELETSLEPASITSDHSQASNLQESHRQYPWTKAENHPTSSFLSDMKQSKTHFFSSTPVKSNGIKRTNFPRLTPIQADKPPHYIDMFSMWSHDEAEVQPISRFYQACQPELSPDLPEDGHFHSTQFTQSTDMSPGFSAKRHQLNSYSTDYESPHQISGDTGNNQHLSNFRKNSQRLNSYSTEYDLPHIDIGKDQLSSNFCEKRQRFNSYSTNYDSSSQIHRDTGNNQQDFSVAWPSGLNRSRNSFRGHSTGSQLTDSGCFDRTNYQTKLSTSTDQESYSIQRSVDGWDWSDLGVNKLEEYLPIPDE